MSRNRIAAAVLALISFTAACSDSPTAPRVATGVRASEQESDGRGWLQRLVAIGTSVSMGWTSDGVNAELQRASWVAQLLEMAGREMDLPLIDGHGCSAPFAAPLLTFTRTSGESVAVPIPACSGANLAGVTLPTANLAIAGIRTGDVLVTTGATATGRYANLYPLVLAAGQTPIAAMEAQNPKIVLVELGANEVLGALTGVAIVGASIVPPAVWKAQYDQVLARVAAKVNKGAVLVGLIDDVADFPAFRRGSEIWAVSGVLAALGVIVQPDCNGSASQNLVFVPSMVVGAIGRAAALQQPQPLSCADGGAGVQDRVLTPAEAQTVNAVLAEMDAHVALRAQQYGWAHFRLDVLYGRAGLKAPFDPQLLMGSITPYGPYISLDGVHPSAQGHTILAQAAAEAIDDTYGLGITTATPAYLARR